MKCKDPLSFEKEAYARNRVFRWQGKTHCRLSLCSFIVMEGGVEAFSYAQRGALYEYR